MKKEETYTMEELISEGKKIDITYYNTSLLEKVNNDLIIPSHNILYDYIDELKDPDISVEVTLSPEEYRTYNQNPKLLAYKLYNHTDFYFILMILNNICDIKDFNKKKVRVLRPDKLNIIAKIMNAKKNVIMTNRQQLESNT